MVEKNSRIKCMTSLKNLQRKEVSKPPMSNMLKKIDEGNERTNQMSVSEKNREHTRERQEREKQIMKGVKILG